MKRAAVDPETVLVINDNAVAKLCQRHSGKPFSTLMKKALITGITGQDGSYLTELLLPERL